jgi:hypothetical protein
MPHPQPGSAQGSNEVQNSVQSLPDANEFSSAIIRVTKRAIYANMLGARQATLKDVTNVVVGMIQRITASAFDLNSSSAQLSSI